MDGASPTCDRATADTCIPSPGLANSAFSPGVSVCTAFPSGGVGWDILSNVVQAVLHIINLKVIRKSHQVHEFSCVQKPVFLRVYSPHHGLLHDCSKAITIHEPWRVVPVSKSSPSLLDNVLEILNMCPGSFPLVPESLSWVLGIQPVNKIVLPSAMNMSWKK